VTAGRQLLYWSAGFLVACLALWLLGSILLPFVAGIAVAYLLDPAADRLERLGAPRWLAATAGLLGFLVAVLLLLLLLLPVLQSQVGELANRLPGLLTTLRERVLPELMDLLERFGIESRADLKQAASGATQNAMSVIGGVLTGALTGGAAIVNLLSLLFITPIVAFYLLRDWDLIVAAIDAWLPRQHAPEIRAIARDIDAVLASFVRGQGTVCLALGIFYAVTLSLAGLNFALVIGILIGMIAFIPFVGAIVGGILSMLLAITQFWPDWEPIAVVAGIFVLGQALEGNVLAPRLLGSSVGLHPVWVMFALLAGGALFGFVGVLVAVPVAAAVGVMVRHAHARYLASALYLGAAPPSDAAPPPPEP